MRKTIKILTGFIFLFVFLSTLMGMDDKSEEGWIRLFNGENLDGWIIKISGHKLNKNYNNTFRVKDGVLKVSYDNYKKFNGEFGHIF